MTPRPPVHRLLGEALWQTLQGSLVFIFIGPVLAVAAFFPGVVDFVNGNGAVFLLWAISATAGTMNVLSEQPRNDKPG